MGTSTPTRAWSEARSPEPGYQAVRVYVWELPVRVSHWATVIAVAVLCFTGYYMHNPFIISRGSRAYLMGTMRFIHLLSAFLFISAFLLRMYWFFAGNEWARWRSFVPLRRERWRGMGAMVKYYTFFQRDLKHHVGHNALAGITYTLMFFLMFVEIVTGLALYSDTLNNRALSALIGWLPRLIDIQYLRLIHFGIMFAFLMFVIHHVYSAQLVSWEERNSLIESIYTGYKFVPESEAEDLEASAESQSRA